MKNGINSAKKIKDVPYYWAPFIQISIPSNNNDKNKKIKKKFYLDKNNFLCWIKKNTFYDNITVGSKSVHIESLAGPFRRKKDRVYLK